MPDTTQLEYATTQLNLSILSANLAQVPEENRRARLLESLRACHTALTLFLQLDHITYARKAAQQLHAISEQCGDLFPELWAELNVGDVPAWLQGMRMPDVLRELFEKFSAAREEAQENKTVEGWRAAAQLAEELLAHSDAARLPYTPEQWHNETAKLWNQVGNVSSEEGNYADALTAYNNAMRHQPNEAMWHRNRANTNIELGNLDAAEEDIRRAEELEPGHARLAELRAEMENKRHE